MDVAWMAVISRGTKTFMESGFSKQENYRNVPSLEHEKETLKLQLAENQLLVLYEHPTTYRRVMQSHWGSRNPWPPGGPSSLQVTSQGTGFQVLYLQGVRPA